MSTKKSNWPVHKSFSFEISASTVQYSGTSIQLHLAAFYTILTAEPISRPSQILHVTNSMPYTNLRAENRCIDSKMSFPRGENPKFVWSMTFVSTIHNFIQKLRSGLFGLFISSVYSCASEAGAQSKNELAHSKSQNKVLLVLPLYVCNAQLWLYALIGPSWNEQVANIGLSRLRDNKWKIKKLQEHFLTELSAEYTNAKSIWQKLVT